MSKYQISEKPVHGVTPEIFLRPGAHGVLSYVDIYDDCSVLHITGEQSGHIISETRDGRFMDFMLSECDDAFMRRLSKEYRIPLPELQEAAALEIEYRSRISARPRHKPNFIPAPKRF